MDVPVRPAVEERPRSLYVDGGIDRGDTVAGERRSAANKRRRSTVIPVDEELRRVLVRWLAVRPDPRSPAEPLFVSTREWGRRVTPAMVRRVVREHASAVGWYRDGAGSEENVTPHYFRHFFTTHLRDRTGDRGVVKYLRGDVASDIIDTYTHDWGDRVREAYVDNIYSLLSDDASRLSDV
jgi:integrase